jgi:hypothetical protein
LKSFQSVDRFDESSADAFSIVHVLIRAISMPLQLFATSVLHNVIAICIFAVDLHVYFRKIEFILQIFA